ncbi:MAG: ABC transporter ATP-binding protein [Nitrosomonas sp.]
MSSEIALQTDGLGKCFHIYDKPRDRLLQMFGTSKKKFFREFWALRDISFTISKGEIIGVIGTNGSGKSTLLQIIAGTLSPTIGTVNVIGRVSAILELGAGFNTEFTGRENVLLNAAIIGFSRDAIAEQMEKIRAFSELGDFFDQPIKTYSSGMQARLAFSIAIHVDPEILIVDEALAVGDARFVAKCMRRIKDIMSKGTTILFVSHDISSVRTLCSRALWLDQGYLVEDGDVFPVTGRYMAYMFKNDQPSIEASNLTHKNIARHKTKSTKLSELPIENQADSSLQSEITGNGQISLPDSRPEITLDSKPITHWGSYKGIILSASVRDNHGVRKNTLHWGAPIEIFIDLRIPPEISRDHLSIAFSIKDLKGTDLIVSTTHDFELKRLPEDERFSISFKLTNPLVTGKYLLVAAVENRRYRDIHYYEYFEGAHYFVSLSEERFFGLFQPSIEQEIILK